MKKFHLFLGSHMQYQKHYANDADELERSSETKAHLEKSINVSDLKTTDEDSFLSINMMIRAKNIIMKERIWINRVINETTFVTHCEATGHFLPVRQYINVTIAACTHVDRTERASMVSIRTVAIVILDSRRLRSTE